MEKARPLSLSDVRQFKQQVMDKGAYYPTSVNAWTECPYRYVYDRVFKGADTPEQLRGKRIHDAIRQALGCEVDVCQELFPVVDHLPVTKYEVEPNLFRLVKPRLYATFEAHLTKEWRGIRLAGYIDMLSLWVSGAHEATAVTDFKTMGKIRNDKIAHYVESIQFAWYAYLSDAWVVYCMPIEAYPQYEEDGLAAYAAGRKFVTDNPGLCVKTFPDVKQEFETVCADAIVAYDTWIRNSKSPDRKPNKFCHWCAAWRNGVCNG